MQYMLLIHTDHNRPRETPEELEAVYAEYGRLLEEMRERNVLLSSSELQRMQTAKTVRVREGDTLVTDGPFAETKEHLGGYFLVECDSVDEAIEWAAKIPSARIGSIEVRPVVES